MNKIYLISNNQLLEGLSYNNSANLDTIRKSRPLNEKGEEIAKALANSPLFQNVENIYCSFYSSSIATSKYLASKLEYKINLDERLNECSVGVLGSKNMKMVKGLQDHEFTYKLPNGESLVDVGTRLNNFIKMLMNKEEEAILFTHKRAILGFLLKYTKVGYNLDENLILEFNGSIVYDDSETDCDIYELVVEKNTIKEINKIN